MGKSEIGAPRYIDLLKGSDLAIATTDTVRSASFIFPNNAAYSIEVELESDGSVNVQIDLEQSNDGESWIIPDGLSAIDTITDENRHVYPLAPTVMIYGRIKFTGLTGNDASCAVKKLRFAYSPNIS